LVISVSEVGAYLEFAPLMTQYGPWVPNASGVCGFAVRVEDLRAVDTAVKVKRFFSIFEGLGPVFDVRLAPNGTFQHYFYTEDPFDHGYVGASSQGLRSATWAYVEFKWTVGDAPDGRWVTRLNDIVIFDLTVNQADPTRRRVAGSSFSFDYSGIWNAVRLMQVPVTSTACILRVCDFYLADQQTNGGDYVVSDFLGDGTIGAIYPNAAGDFAGWTPDGGGANVDKVKEKPPDDDTTTVSGTTPGIQDAHNMDDVPAGAVILCYQQLIRAKKTSLGSVVIDPCLRIGGVNYVSTGQGVSSADHYEYKIQPYDNNPATLAQITESEANGMQGSYIKEV
jgi:hypothetical protein